MISIVIFQALTLCIQRPFKIKSPPCLVILQPYENRGVYILHPDWWLERPQSICTPRGRKVLNENWGKLSMQNNVADLYAPFYGYVSH
jgi:hypothetical protein